VRINNANSLGYFLIRMLLRYCSLESGRVETEERPPVPRGLVQGFSLLNHQFVGDVVLVDIADVLEFEMFREGAKSGALRAFE